MKVGFFTDTYFPQISGVATSIKTLKEELEKKGHEVYIFTTTDPKAMEPEGGIYRMPSIPFVSFKDRRIVIRGMADAYAIAKDLGLDVVHTHTEFGTGILGKFVAKRLEIPCVHTYHTMYEDYLHYILKGKVIRPSHVRQLSRAFCRHLSGIICPSERVVDTLRSYDITVPMEVIPTGINLEKFQHAPFVEKNCLKEKLGIQESDYLLLSLSRLSYEKNIQGIISELPKLIAQFPTAYLAVVGDGPYRHTLEALVKELKLENHVFFIGEVTNEEVGTYYQAADYFVSTSSSESQGLTYIEAIAAGTRCIVKGNVYLNQLFDSESLGVTFAEDQDFVPTFASYIQKRIQTDKNVREKKLYEISSECFGERIELFYQEAILHHERYFVKEEIERPNIAVRIFRRK